MMQLFGLTAFISLVAAQVVLKEALCPIDLPVSCTNSTPVADTCCFESPGGILLQTQFWDYQPAIGPADKFTLHGLWPDKCDGAYEQFCDPARETHGSKISQIIKRFNETLYEEIKKNWLSLNGRDEYLWEHEFNKHATCLSTLRPVCYGDDYTSERDVYDYFQVTANLFDNLPTFEFLGAEGIVPSYTRTYTKKQVAAALKKHFGKEVYFKCDSKNGLQEVWYYHYLKGSVRQQQFVPVDSLHASRCPETGIKLYPKKI